LGDNSPRKAARPSILSAIFAVSLVAMTAGCQSPPPPAPIATPPLADRVVVLKSRRLLELLRDGKVLDSFPIALGREPFGAKQQEGDGRTPEGIYRIDYRSMQSKYTRALHISYPDVNDRQRAMAMNVDPGGAIFIHGLPNDYGPSDPPQWYKDWTEGCISVGNLAIVKIWDEVPDGTPVEIRP
jgi:murein L,D-transpeptidase YafK